MIETNLGLTFEGETKREATEFISQNMEASKQAWEVVLRERFESEANSYSLPNQ